MTQKRILIVEDEADIRAIIREFLEGCGYEVVCAQSLSQARFLVDEVMPDLVLLDVMLPDGTGFDFCAELRGRTQVPVIFLTCRDENDDVVQGLELGGDDYIIKPCDLNVLRARVEAQLRRSATTTAGVIDLPPLHIDILAGEATLDGLPIRLTYKELQLLSCFALYAGQRLSCERLYKQAWGGVPQNVSQTIAVHVANLRRKLGLSEDSAFELRNAGNGEYVLSRVRY